MGMTPQQLLSLLWQNGQQTGQGQPPAQADDDGPYTTGQSQDQANKASTIAAIKGAPGGAMSEKIPGIGGSSTQMPPFAGAGIGQGPVAGRGPFPPTAPAQGAGGMIQNALRTMAAGMMTPQMYTQQQEDQARWDISQQEQNDKAEQLAYLKNKDQREQGQEQEKIDLMRAQTDLDKAKAAAALKGKTLKPEEQMQQDVYNQAKKDTALVPGGPGNPTIAAGMTSQAMKPPQQITPYQQAELGVQQGSKQEQARHNRVEEGIAGQRERREADAAALKQDPNTPTTQTKNQAQSAATVQKVIPQLTSEIDQLATKIGPGAGRWNNFWVNKAGANDPAYSKLDTELDLYASALVRTHFGARGGQEYRQELRKQFSQAQSPEDLKARIQGADTWLRQYAAAAQPAGQQQPDQQQPLRHIDLTK